MSKIYLPTEFLNKPCYIVNNDYIRVYDSIDLNQQNVVYDVYINQDYMVKQSRASYSTQTVCDDLNVYTDDWYYRVDLFNILGCIFILSFFLILIPFQILFKFFKRSGMNV